jgi:hypothetical protein
VIRKLETDYLVIWQWRGRHGITDALIADSDRDVIMVDRRPRARRALRTTPIRSSGCTSRPLITA